MAGLLKQYRQRMTSLLLARLSAGRNRLEAMERHRAFRFPRARIHDLARRLDELEARAGRRFAADSGTPGSGSNRLPRNSTRSAH